MPDWSYHPIFRPLLFLLSPERARDLTLRAIGTLAKCPGGPSLIEQMGHMKPPQELSRTWAGISFSSPVGIGAGLDPYGTGLQALSRFGVGYIELGPITAEPFSSHHDLLRQADSRSILYPGEKSLENPGVHVYRERLRSAPTLGVPVGARLASRPGATISEATAEVLFLAKQLRESCSFFSVDTRWLPVELTRSRTQWRAFVRELRKVTDLPLFLLLPPDSSEPYAAELFQPAWEEGFAGVLVAGGIQVESRLVGCTHARLTGPSVFASSRAFVQWLRQSWPESIIIGSGGIHEPADALHMLSAGADLISLHSGLVYSGPGLPKRINEAIWQTRSQPEANPIASTETLPSSGKSFVPPWVWGMLLGIGMIVGGALAWFIAATSVVLPYDESFLGMGAAELVLLNSRLLPFMSHDRISLAGTMISIGVIYCGLARHGLRHGHHAARQILLVSGAVGFSSFFLFIGYGYFDALHAILAIILFPAFLLALRAPAGIHLPTLPVQLSNDTQWRRALWGQLSFVVIGFGLTAAGVIISLIGVTGVFVPSDLLFLCASPEMLQAYNERLIPLIAHDRAGFGGALVSDGIAVLLLSLWGFRRGERWIWRTLCLSGLPGFAAGIGVHFSVGYTDFLHLLPAFVAFAIFLLGLWLSRPHLLARS